MRLLFLSLFCASQIFSQTKRAKGFVFDEVTNQPIPYVNISIIESNNGTSSDENGSFELEIKTDDINKKALLSSLGYENLIISVEELIYSKKLYLKVRIETLNEVLLSDKFEEKILKVNELEEEDLCSGFATNEQKPWMLALHFPYKEIYSETNFLKTVKFYFGNHKNKKAKFRLRILSVNNEGLPGEDLLVENVIIELKKHQKIAEVDISKFNLIIPDAGVYIAFEWLYIPYNTYVVSWCLDKKCRKTEKRTMFSPTFSGFCNDEDNFKMARFGDGFWWLWESRNYTNGKNQLPAISLTLSN